MSAGRRWLLLILAAALVLRLGWSLTRPADDAYFASLPDQVEYLSLARSLLDKGSLSFHDPRFDQTVHAYRTPGYPAFLAACGANVTAARIAQCLIDTSTVLAVYLLANRLTRSTGAPPVSALFAAAITAFNPLLLYFSALLLTETLFVACLVWSLYLCTSRRTWIAGAILLIFCVLVRPSALVLALVLPPLAFLMRKDEGGRMKDEKGKEPPSSILHPPSSLSLLPRLILPAVLLLLALGLWSERNKRVLGDRIWLTTNEGVTRYDGFNPAADGSSNQSFLADVPRLRDMTEVERDETLSQLAASYISSHPARVGELALRKIARTWSPLPLSDQFGSSPKYVLVGLTYTVPFFVLTLMGLLKTPVPRGAKLLLMTPALYFTAVHAFSVGSLRYRLPAEPPMAVLAGCAVSLFLPTSNKQRATSH